MSIVHYHFYILLYIISNYNYKREGSAKKIISVCMVFVVMLMSFTACDKFREITNGWHNKAEINDERALHLNDSGSPEPAANNKESWSEWTSRQWNENRVKWIGSIVGTALVATGIFLLISG
jgi:hypothetical protein